MSRLLDVIFYICHRARFLGTALPKARLVKLVYLADWKSAVDKGCQITEVKWLYNHYGPYVKEIIDLIDSNPNFVRRNYINHFGKTAEKIDLNDQVANELQHKANLNSEEIKIIDFITDITKDMGYNEFLRLVYSTYPIIKSDKYEILDLVELAKGYKTFKNERAINQNLTL